MTAAMPEAGTIDLKLLTPCPPAGEEIVVCGRRAEDEKFRLRPLLSQRFEPRPLRATTGVGTGTLGVEGEQVIFPGGVPSNRVMLKFKLPF